MKIVWNGIFNDTSSMGIVSYHMAKSLMRLGHEVYADPWPESNFQLVDRHFRKYAGEHADVFIRFSDPYSASSGRELVERGQVKALVPFMYFDKGLLEPEVVDRLNQIPHMITNSQFTRSILLRAGVRRHIHVVPLGVDENECKGISTAKDQGDTLKLIYAGYLGGFRKGTDLLLDVFHTFLKDNHRVELVLKTDSGCHFGVHTNNVRVINQTTDRQTMYRLLAEAHYFIAPARMETYGMIGLEAAAVGTSVIYPLNSAYSEYAKAMPYSEILTSGSWNIRHHQGLREMYWEVMTQEIYEMIDYLWQTKSYKYNSDEVKKYALQYSWNHVAGILAEKLSRIVR